MLRKICGMTRQMDVEYASMLGFDFCGFIFYPPSPRHIEPERVKLLRSGDMQRTGVFVRQNVKEITETMRIAKLDFAQLHGPQTMEDARHIGIERVIRVLWPTNYSIMADLQSEIDRHSNYCSFFLLDAGKTGGGSGLKLDWASLVCLEWPRPWFLAGGLDAASLQDAIKGCHPDGVDINSGVESAPGIKDWKKMEKAAQEIEKAGL